MTHRPQKNAIPKMTVLLLWKDTNLNQPREEGHRTESRWGLNAKLVNSLSPWSRGWCDLLPAMVCDSMSRVLPTREAHASLYCPQFFFGGWGGLNHILPTWLPFSLQTSLEFQTNTLILCFLSRLVPKSHHKSHGQADQWSKPPDKDIPIRKDIPGA